MCVAEQNACAEKISLENDLCKAPCEGIISDVFDFDKHDPSLDDMNDEVLINLFLSRLIKIRSDRSHPEIHNSYCNTIIE